MKSLMKRQEIIDNIIFWVDKLKKHDQENQAIKRKRAKRKTEIMILRYKEEANKAEIEGKLDEFLLNSTQKQADFMSQKHFERWRELGGGK